MKKLFIFSIAISLILNAHFPVNAKSLDVENWYEYNNYSTLHAFNIKFPPDWQVRTIDEQIQGFAPKNKYKEPPMILLQEFEGQSYKTVIDYYKDSDTSLTSVTDILLSTKNGDLLGKEATYQKKSSGGALQISIFKRGGLIVAVAPQSDDYGEIFKAMVQSFYFNDDWHVYLDFNNKYTFIFPSRLELKTFDSGVEIKSKSTKESIFTVIKKENFSLESISEKSQKINFHDLNAAIADYSEDNKKFSRVLVEKDVNLFSLTNINQDADYYDEYVQEMLESFEFFEMISEEDVNSYQSFFDVKDIHPNAKAINGLFQSKVIGGYEDGTFRPDAEISRAELAKMIVASKTTPAITAYHDCFTDVKQEWFAPYICYAKSKIWIEGYSDGSFKPDSKVSRAEAVKVILNGFFGKINSKEILKNQSVSDVNLSEWYGKYFIFADNRNLLDKQHIQQKNDTYLYLPSKNITRKEIAEMIYRIKNL